MKGLMRNVLRILLKGALMLFMIFVLALLATTIADYRPAEKEDLSTYGEAAVKIPDKGEFTAMSWNLGYFGLGAGMDFFYENGEQVRPGEDQYFQYEKSGLEFLGENDSVDFILLQEVDRNSKRSYRQDQFQKIKDNLPDYSADFALNYKVPFVPIPVSRPMGKVTGGIATLGRQPVEESTRYALPGRYPWPKGIFLLDRCFILSRFPLQAGKDLVIINTHNEAFDDGDMRDQQMRLLRKTMVEEYKKGNYVVAGGDWNINPAGYNEKTVSNGDTARTIQPDIDPRFYPMGWNWAFDPSVPTNRGVSQVYKRGRTPTTIIDYFITSPNVRVIDVQTVDLEFKWSDHQPVMLKFQLKDQS